MKRALMALTAVFHFSLAAAAEYTIDHTHSFIEWRVQHLGYSWLYGRFNDVTGSFTWDEKKPGKSVIEVEINTDSIDSNHALRDKHLRDKKYLNVKKFPEATFKSTAYTGTADKGVLEGVLTLHGVSKPVSFEVTRLGEGNDPWGGYRAGFEGHVTLDRRDFGIEEDIGPKSFLVELSLGIEGIRQNQPPRIK